MICYEGVFAKNDETHPNSENTEAEMSEVKRQACYQPNCNYGGIDNPAYPGCTLTVWQECYAGLYFHEYI